MPKHKKKIVIIVISIIIFLSYLLQVSEVKAAEQTIYKDWSELTELDKAYSYSRIFYNENTQIQVKKCGKSGYGTIYSEDGIEYPDKITIRSKEEAILVITNCAVNEEGQTLDAIIKINNVNEWNEKSTGVAIGFISDTKLKSQDYLPTDKGGNCYDYEVPIHRGELITFILFANNADCDFTIMYRVSGTYKYEDNNEKDGIDGKITNINGYYYDIDIPCRDKNYANQFLQGKEGIIPNVGSSKIYYNKNGKGQKTKNGYYAILQELDNGICMQERNVSCGADWNQTAAYVATTNINNSTYSFKYGGIDCGMKYKFVSPYPLIVQQEFYKIKLYTADGNMINSIELRDGKAISELKDSFITDAIYLIADNEIVQGSRIEIESRIKVKNNSVRPCKKLAIEQKLAGGLVCNTEGWETNEEIATLRIYGDEKNPVIEPYGEYETVMVASRLLASREYEFQNAVIAYEIDGKIEATSEQGLSETIRIIPPFGKTRRFKVVLVGIGIIVLVIMIRKFRNLIF